MGGGTPHPHLFVQKKYITAIENVAFVCLIHSRNVYLNWWQYLDQIWVHAWVADSHPHPLHLILYREKPQKLRTLVPAKNVSGTETKFDWGCLLNWHLAIKQESSVKKLKTKCPKKMIWNGGNVNKRFVIRCMQSIHCIAVFKIFFGCVS